MQGRYICYSLIFLLNTCSVYAQDNDSEIIGINAVKNHGTNSSAGDGLTADYGDLIVSPSVKKVMDSIYSSAAQPKINTLASDINIVDSKINSAEQDILTTKSLVDRTITETKKHEIRRQDDLFKAAERNLNSSIQHSVTGLANKLSNKVSSLKTSHLTSANNYSNDKAVTVNSSGRNYAYQKLANAGGSKMVGWQELWRGNSGRGVLSKPITNFSEVIISQLSFNPDRHWSTGPIPVAFAKEMLGVKSDGVTWKWVIIDTEMVDVSGIYAR